MSDVCARGHLYVRAGTPVEIPTCVSQTFIQQVIGNGVAVTSMKE